MGATYRGVHWNRQKRLYDAVIAIIIVASIGPFFWISLAFKPGISAETLIIRGTALTAIILLHLILCMGPLARIDKRFLPLLYNRRHFGVTMFVLAAIHAVFSIVQFHAFGNLNPLLSVFTSYRREYGIPSGIEHFPFEPFGFLALTILFLMAATSHDFWLHNLGASFWKTMHCGVYVAYGSLIVHVAYGILQSEPSWFYPVLLSTGFIAIACLHFTAALKEYRKDHQASSTEDDGYVRACGVQELEEDKGHVAIVAGKRVAVYAQEGRVYALSNVCRHQGGPVGEGCIVDGFATCPWHGWQYRLDNGQSPPPFDTEFVPTHNVRVEDGGVFVDPNPNPPLTVCEGVRIDAGRTDGARREFFIGYLPKMPEALARHSQGVAAVTAVGVLLLAGSVAAIQQPFDEGIFEFGITSTYEGALYERPVPMLVGGNLGSRSPRTHFLLTGPGKTGLPDFAKGQHRARVRFDGTLIARAGTVMIEMNSPESFVPLSGPEPQLDVEDGFADVDFVGELVDTKCYLGVMRPATGKVHRACAVRCLEGGIPPGLLARAGGQEQLYFLAGPDDRPLVFDPQLAGRAVRVRGKAEKYGSIYVIRVTSLRLAGE